MDDLIGFIGSLGRPRVAVLGDFILDSYIYGDCERISPEAPVPVLRVVKRETRTGGAASVAADVLALGAHVCCMGAVGQDAAGEELCAKLMGEGGDVSALIKLKSRPTTSKMRLVGLAQHRHQQQMLRVDEEDASPIVDKAFGSLRGAVRRELRSCQVMAIEDYDKGVLTDETTPEIIAEARAAGIPVIVDPARLRSYARYAGCTLLTPNRYEAELVSGVKIVDEASLELAARKVIESAKAEGVVITLDKEGSYLMRAGQPGRRFPTQPRAVYDVTGAGDMVLAMLCVAISGGASWEMATTLANVAGGLEVERFGVVPIKREELMADLIRLKRQHRGKVLTQAEAALEVERLRQAGKSVVFTNGCFDIVHAGHVDTLGFARRQGDALVVGINSDASVRRNKGENRPIVGEADRAEVLASLECVDFVVLFDEDTPLQLLEKLRPNVLVKGGQYSGPKDVVGRELLESYGGRVLLAPMREGRSSTNVIKKIAAVYGNNHS